MVKVHRNNVIENFNYKGASPKKEHGLTKLFHSIVKEVKSWFYKEPLTDRKIELQTRDEIESVFPKEKTVQKEPPRLMVNEQQVVEVQIPRPKTLELEIAVLKEKKRELCEVLVQMESESNPSDIMRIIDKAFGWDVEREKRMNDQKEHISIITNLIEIRNKERNQLLDPDTPELEEISDDEETL